MKTDGKPIRILLVDDHKSFLDGLTMLVNASRTTMQIVGTANCVKKMLSMPQPNSNPT